MRVCVVLSWSGGVVCGVTFLFFFSCAMHGRRRRRQVHAPARIRTDSVDAFMHETRVAKRISMRIIQVSRVEVESHHDRRVAQDTIRQGQTD